MAVGYAPSTLRSMSAQFAAAATNDTRGRCPHITLLLTLGEPNHPAVKTRKELFHIWQYLARRHTDKVQLSRAWITARTALQTTDTTKEGLEGYWAKVNGPMGATIGTLLDLKWQPVSFFKKRPVVSIKETYSACFRTPTQPVSTAHSEKLAEIQTGVSNT